MIVEILLQTCRSLLGRSRHNRCFSGSSPITPMRPTSASHSSKTGFEIEKNRVTIDNFANHGGFSAKMHTVFGPDRTIRLCRCFFPPNDLLGEGVDILVYFGFGPARTNKTLQLDSLEQALGLPFRPPAVRQSRCPRSRRSLRQFVRRYAVRCDTFFHHSAALPPFDATLSAEAAVLHAAERCFRARRNEMIDRTDCRPPPRRTADRHCVLDS